MAFKILSILIASPILIFPSYPRAKNTRENSSLQQNTVNLQDVFSQKLSRKTHSNVSKVCITSNWRLMIIFRGDVL